MRGSIYKQGKGTYGIRISAGTDPVTKQRRRISATVRGTRATAEAELTRLLRELDTGIDVDPSRLTLGEYLNDQWTLHTKTRVRPSTWRRYASLLRTHIVPALGDVPIQKLRPSHVQAFVDDMNVGYAARTTLQAYRVLSSALKHARGLQLIATNPAEAAKPPRPARPKLVIPTDADALARIRDAAQGHRFERAFIVSSQTGLRRGELLGLRWRDADVDKRTLHIRSTLDERTFELEEPKTDRAKRSVSLPATVALALRAQRAEQTERRLLLGDRWTDRDLVFDRGDGNAINPSLFSRTWRDVASRAGYPGMRLHDARHLYATTLLREDVHPKIVSEGLGHSSVAFTLDTYSHVVARACRSVRRSRSTRRSRVAKVWPELPTARPTTKDERAGQTRGGARNRTTVRGFAVPCLATRPRRRSGKLTWPSRDYSEAPTAARCAPGSPCSCCCT